MLVSKEKNMTETMKKLELVLNAAANEAYNYATEHCREGSVEGVVAAFKMYDRYRKDAHKIGRLADFRKG